MLSKLRQNLIPPLWAAAKRIPGGVWLWERGLVLLGRRPAPTPVALVAGLTAAPRTYLATPEDVLYCYRLLLLREPDPAGWEFWVHRVQNFQVPITGLRDSFLLSDEFRELEHKRGQPHMTEVAGFKLFYYPRDWLVGDQLARYGEYEANVVAVLTPLLKPGKVLLDIGANIGFYTLLAASRVGPRGRVIAFEPHPKNRELLAMSLRENGFQHVDLHPFAVSNTEGVAELFTEPGASNALLGVAGSESAGENPLVFAVRTVVLDNFLKDVARIDIIKMDIEGIEPLAWQGMRDLVRRHRPIVFTEFNPPAIRRHGLASPEDYLTMISAAGYRLHILDEATCQPTPAMTVEQIMAQQALSPGDDLELVAYPN